MTEEFDEGGLPIHLLIPVNEDGEGPLGDKEIPAAIICWCRNGKNCEVLKSEQ